MRDHLEVVVVVVHRRRVEERGDGARVACLEVSAVLVDHLPKHRVAIAPVCAEERADLGLVEDCGIGCNLRVTLQSAASRAGVDGAPDRVVRDAG